MEDLGRDYKDVYYQQRLQPLDYLYDQKHLQRLHDADDINSQYVQSVVAEEYEKQMNEAILQKVVMNGSVVGLIENNKHESIRKQCKDLQNIFYQGEQLTDFEKDIERMYVSAKYEKHTYY
jgi:ribosomal protein L5